MEAAAAHLGSAKLFLCGQLARSAALKKNACKDRDASREKAQQARRQNKMKNFERKAMRAAAAAAAAAKIFVFGEHLQVESAVVN